MASTTPPWTPLGEALLDHLAGTPDRPVVAVVVLEDGERCPLAASDLFRGDETFPEVEAAALELCTGRVLDIGAGAGAHSLALQHDGFDVVALDICPQAVEVMRRRGVRRVVLGDIFAPQVAGLGAFDTLLLMMNGIGVVGDLEGLDRFLRRAARILSPGGQIVLDSCDLRDSDHPREAARIAERTAAGRHPGEARMAIEYRGLRGAPFSWLYLDADTLRRHGEALGFSFQIAFVDDDGTYTARLVR